MVSRVSKVFPITVVSSLGVALGCVAAWGAPLELPEGLREASTVYAVIADHESFDAEEPQQRVTFEVKQGQGSDCATSYRVWGELPRADVSVTEDSETKTVVARRQSELRVKGQKTETLVLRATFEHLTVEADARWAESEVGDGVFFLGEQRAGTFHSEGGVLTVSLARPSGAKMDYVVIAQHYRRQYSIKSSSRALLYAAVDWSYWGFGSRGFEVAIANDLSCEQYNEVVALFLIAKVLTGA